MKRVKLISTGGTISCAPGQDGLAPVYSSMDMLNIADINAERVCCLDLFRMDSSNIQPEEWIEIAQEIKKSRDCDCIVITHGTDTMAYTASMLAFMLDSYDLPVVLTGSQTPIIDSDSDGRKNLSDALVAARALCAGVYICFGGDVILGCRSVKTHTLSLRAFESVNFPLVGNVINEQFVPNPDFSNNLPHKCNLPDSIDPRVALIKLIPGTAPEIITSLLHCNIAGVVIESFGLGGVHNIRRDHNKAILELMDNGIVVVMTSQCLYEGAALDTYAVSRTLLNAGIISAHDMTTEAAVTKLMWVLSCANSIENTHDRLAYVKTLMRQNICGEVK